MRIKEKKHVLLLCACKQCCYFYRLLLNCQICFKTLQKKKLLTLVLFVLSSKYNDDKHNQIRTQSPQAPINTVGVNCICHFY